MDHPEHLAKCVGTEKIWDSRQNDALLLQRFDTFVESGMTAKEFMRSVYLPFGMGMRKAQYDDMSSRLVCKYLSVVAWYCVWCVSQKTAQQMKYEHLEALYQEAWSKTHPIAFDDGDDTDRSASLSDDGKEAIDEVDVDASDDVGDYVPDDDAASEVDEFTGNVAEIAQSQVAPQPPAVDVSAVARETEDELQLLEIVAGLREEVDE